MKKIWNKIKVRISVGFEIKGPFRSLEATIKTENTTLPYVVKLFENRIAQTVPILSTEQKKDNS